MSSTDHSFDAVTTWTPGDNRWAGRVPESWMQGRAAFGGVITAAALRTMRTRVAPDRPPRSIATAFLRPVGPGEVCATVEVLREGRAVTQVEARVYQENALCAVLTGAFGADRRSGVRVPPERRPDRPGPEDSVAMPYLPGLTPEFVQHIDLRWTDGGFPYTAHSEAAIGGWCRFREQATGYEGVLGLLDAWPAPVLSLLKRPAPASTVRWSAHLIGPPPEPGSWLWFRARAETAGEGYASTRGQLFGPDGALLAWMEQLVAVFDG